MRARVCLKGNGGGDGHTHALLRTHSGLKEFVEKREEEKTETDRKKERKKEKESQTLQVGKLLFCV